MYTYIGEDNTRDSHPELFMMDCEIVRALVDKTDPVPESDMYLVRFEDGQQIEVFPTELSPIPAPGTGRTDV